MTFDPAPWRNDTAAALAGRIHLNNAGASLMPQPILDAVRSHLELEAHLGGYEAADAARPDIDGAYEDVAALLGTRARNVAVVENATVAFAQALSAFDFAPRDVILTTRNDYASNQLMYLSLAARRGVDVVRADDLDEGGVDPDSIRRLLRERRPKLCAVTWVPTSSRLIQPVAEIGQLCADAQVPCIVDACQAVGQIEIDVAALQCDFLAGTARKFLRGPRGVGFLFVSDAMLEQQRAPLWIDMRGADWTEAERYTLADSARRFENWEFAYALLLGLGGAAKYARNVGVAAAGAYAAELAAYARSRIGELPGARVLDRGRELAAIVTVEIAGHDPAGIVRSLREQAINTSWLGRAQAVLDLDGKGTTRALRISPHYYNTRREIDIVVSALEGFAG